MNIPWIGFLASSIVGSALLVRYNPKYSVNASYFGTFWTIFLLQVSCVQFYRMIIWPFFLSPLRHLPQPKNASWHSGNFADIRRWPSGEPMAKWIEEVDNDGLIYYRIIFNAERVILTTPKAIGEVLVQKSYDFIKPTFLRAGIAQILGVGLVLAEGDEHKKQRKSLMPAFAYRQVRDLTKEFWNKSRLFVNAMTKEIEAQSQSTLSEKSKTANGDLDASNGHTTKETATPVLNIMSWTARATLDIIGSAGMGHDFNTIDNPDNELMNSYKRVFDPSRSARALQILQFVLPGWFLRALPVKRNGNIRESAATIRRICREIVQESRTRLSNKEEKRDIKDIVSVAIESGGFSDENLVHQMMTFLAAGHETTATAMTWAMYELCRQPKIQTRLREEVHAKLPSLNDTEFQLDGPTLDKLPYLHAVCNEILRLHSPLRMTIREAAVNTSIVGQYIPKGTKVVIAPWGINTTTKLWGPDAKKFDPERWLKPGQAGTGGAVSNYAFLTFLHGPRSCIGQQFAKAEFAAILAAVVGRFEMELDDPDLDVEIQAGLTARPKGGLLLKMKIVDGW